MGGRCLAGVALAVMVAAGVAASADEARPEPKNRVTRSPAPNAADEPDEFTGADRDSDATPGAEAVETHGNLNLKEKGGAVGEYQGVAPGGQRLPPHPPKLPIVNGPQRMTWPGFQIKDGVPMVFLELTGVPDYSVQEGPGAVTVTLKNTVVPLRNNRRPLRVASFDTAVKDVETRARRHDVQVIIRTKQPSRPSHHERVEEAAGGFRLLVIELPPGK